MAAKVPSRTFRGGVLSALVALRVAAPEEDEDGVEGFKGFRVSGLGFRV